MVYNFTMEGLHNTQFWLEPRSFYISDIVMPLNIESNKPET